MKQIPTSDHNCRKTIRGMVVPAQWDDRFQITGILVACRDEREIRIENLGNFPDLKKLAQTEALFTGILKKRGSTESILLESYTPIDTDKK